MKTLIHNISKAEFLMSIIYSFVTFHRLKADRVLGFFFPMGILM